MPNKTRWILIFSFFITLMIFFGVLSYGLAQFESVRNQSRKIVQNNNTKTELIVSMLSSARERVVDLFAMVNSDDPFIRDDVFLHFNKQGAIFANARGSLLDLELSSQEQELLLQQGKLTGVSVPLQNKLVELIQTDEIQQAKDLLNEEAVEAQNKVLEQLVKLLDLQQRSSNEILVEIDKEYGSGRYLILFWSLIAFLLGGIVALFVIIRTTKIEHKLFEEVEKARATLGSISDAIIRTDKNGIIVYSNIKADEMLETDLTGLEVKKALYFMHDNDVRDAEETSRNDLGQYLITVQNKKRWLEITQDNIKSETGDITGKVLVLHDLTEVMKGKEKLEAANTSLEARVKERTERLQNTNNQLEESLNSLAAAQEQLVHSEKMAALGGLVAGISHEINTPIGIGVTSATNIEEKMHELEEVFLSGKLTRTEFESYINHTRKALDILISNLRRASDLIRSFKQVAVDQTSDELRDIDLRSYCDEIIMSLHPKLKSTNINIKNIIPNDIHIYTNPGAIYQVISNLILNSIVHAFDKESPDKLPEVIIDSGYSGDEVIINYSDNGKGVDEDALSRIYEPFFTTKRGQGGSGLGMNVVYNLITTSLKGKINATSELGNGLSVIMNIPVQQKGDTHEH